MSGSREDSHIPPSSLEGLGEARAPRSTPAGNWGPCGGRRVKGGEGLEKLLSGMAVTELSLILGWDGLGWDVQGHLLNSPCQPHPVVPSLSSDSAGI